MMSTQEYDKRRLINIVYVVIAGVSLAISPAIVDMFKKFPDMGLFAQFFVFIAISPYLLSLCALFVIFSPNIVDDIPKYDTSIFLGMFLLVTMSIERLISLSKKDSD
jgi:hypothetical protein